MQKEKKCDIWFHERKNNWCLTVNEVRIWLNVRHRHVHSEVKATIICSFTTHVHLFRMFSSSASPWWAQHLTRTSELRWVLCPWHLHTRWNFNITRINSSTCNKSTEFRLSLCVVVVAFHLNLLHYFTVTSFVIVIQFLHFMNNHIF